ncbi:MAG: CocE/NonD family hydrolase [Polyangiaceae bacterium]
MRRTFLRLGLLVSWTSFAASCASACAAPRALAGPDGRKAVERRPVVPAPIVTDAELADALREHYTKFEWRIPMRDGVKLHTVAFVPKDPSRTYPVMLERTPYGVKPYGADEFPDASATRPLRRVAPSAEFVREGYVLVHQDVRGKMMSEGTFVDVRPVVSDAPNAPKDAVDESTDAWDTIDWLVKNAPRNNGKVGVWGISYPGFYAAQSAIHAHPALRAVSPQAPVTEWFLGDDFHHNGAFFLADAYDFYTNFGKPRPTPTKKMAWAVEHDAGDVYDFFLRAGSLGTIASTARVKDVPFWNDLMTHGTRDAWWTARDPRPHYKDVKPAVMTVGGLFDAEDLFGAVATYRAFESQSPGADNTLVLGPWRHGGWARTNGDAHGDVSFAAKTSEFYRTSIEFPFFQKHLAGVDSGAAKVEAWVFETGTNEWRAHASWPPVGTKPTTYVFDAGFRLVESAPDAAASDPGRDAYTSDPSKPVPYRARMGAQIDGDYMSDDQRFATRRPDVLTYTTKTLESDVTVAGPVRADLWVTTTGTDADFVVKIIDAYPEDLEGTGKAGTLLAGYEQLVRGEVMRAKFRNGFDKPEALVPGAPTRVAWTLPDVSHTFRTGHRIVVQVQSSWFPLVDRNPQVFTDIYHAKEGDFRPATHTILRRAPHVSSVVLPILGRAGR